MRIPALFFLGAGALTSCEDSTAEAIPPSLASRPAFPTTSVVELDADTLAHEVAIALSGEISENCALEGSRHTNGASTATRGLAQVNFSDASWDANCPTQVIQALGATPATALNVELPTFCRSSIRNRAGTGMAPADPSVHSPFSVMVEVNCGAQK